MAIVSPIFTALFWTLFKGWGSGIDIVAVAVVSVLLFLALWWIAFVVSAVLTPKLLDDDRIAEYSQLERAKKELQDLLPKHPQALVDRVRKFLADNPHGGREILEYLMVHEKMNAGPLRMEAAGPALIESGILKREEYWFREGVSRGQDRWSIAAQYTPIIHDLLYGPSSGNPLHQ